MKSIGLVNSGKPYPVMKLVSDSPEIAAIISKMVRSPVNQPIYGADGSREILTPNTYEFRNLSWRTARSAADSKAVMQMLPDMELSAQILISSILSPKDMMTTELIFTAPEGVLPAQVSGALLGSIRQHFDQVYKIKPLLSKILRDILFEKGSHVRAVIPENSLDEIINRHTAITMESISDLVDKNGKVRPLGILGPSKITASDHDPAPSMSLESFNEYNYSTVYKDIDNQITIPKTKSNDGEVKNPYVLVTDNPDVLKFPKIRQKLTTQRIHGALNTTSSLFNNINKNARTALESIARSNNPGSAERRLSDRELSAVIYKNPGSKFSPVSVMKTPNQLKRHAVSMPLIMELPPESVIPVHVPGQEDKHIGYFVLLDINGNPINSSSDKDYYAELSERMNNSASGNSFPGQLMQRVKSMYNGFDCNNREHLDYSARVYADMIEQDLLARLRNGVYTNGVALARNEEVYRIMLSRTFARQQTQLLFLPVELVTYFAFRYTSDGIGKSLLEDMKVLNSLRTMVMFANVMASVRNSVAQTNVKLKLDEQDPDPAKTIERMMSEIIRAKQQSFPLGANSPVDLVNWLQRAGYQFSFEGHPGMPDVQVEFSEGSTNYPKPDSELEENLRKRAIMSTGLNPETVDNGFNGEFATSVVASNILLSRRVMQIQEQFTPFLSDHAQKTITATPSLLSELRTHIANAYDKLGLDDDWVKEIAAGSVNEKDAVIDYLLLTFINGIEAQLPRPNTVTLENQYQSYESYIKMLDPMLDSFISTDFFTEEMGGDVAQHVATVRNVLKAYFVRKWAAENGVLPELSEITAMGDDDAPMTDFWEMQKNHMESLTRTLTGLMRGLQPTKTAANTVLAATTDSDETAGTGGEQTYGDASGSDLGNDGDLGGGDDLGGLDDGLSGDLDGSSADLPEDDNDDLQSTGTSEKPSTTDEEDKDSAENKVVSNYTYGDNQ